MLLLVFREGVRRRKFTEVAAALGVTQAAISHAVARLRDILGDELFLRRPHGVEPTARTVELAAIADGILRDAGRLLADPAPFDPRTARRRFTIATLDYESALLAALVGRLTTEGPGLDVFFRPLARAEATTALEEGRVDLAIGFRPPADVAYKSVPLFEETYTTIVRAGHPRIGATLDLDAFCDEGHVVAAPARVARAAGGQEPVEGGGGDPRRTGPAVARGRARGGGGSLTHRRRRQVQADRRRHPDGIPDEAADAPRG